MAEFFNALTNEHTAFIARQPVFFVATAAAGARVNLSPKGMDAFRVLGPNLAGYLDVGGSGNETQAHLTADGRITIMFCAFDKSALILRLYGRGRFVLPQDPQWAEHMGAFAILPGTRQIFLVDIESVQTSCGWGVPYMSFDRERDTLSRAHQSKDRDARVEKLKTRTKSIDGLPVRIQTAFPDLDG
jgi:Pyridoxamine 5'-phosphate oxidase